jgi:phosphatidate phosphatase APP1
MDSEGPVLRGVQAVLRQSKRLKRGVKRRLHLFTEPRVVPFRAHGTPERVFLSGRVLERTGVVDPNAKPGGVWLALGRSFRRFESDEIPGAHVEIRLGPRTVHTETDEEGYFHVELEPHSPLSPGWHDYEVRLLSSIAGGEGVQGRGQVLVPAEDAEFGIISDLDDTVVATRAHHQLERTRIVLLNDAHERTPFPGVGAFYRALSRGPDGRGTNPLFYLSRSPWNLYDLFDRFLDLHDIPRGPLFLEDASLVEPPSRSLGGRQPKQERIRGLMELYPRLCFVLVGDSGQQDPEVYREVVRAFPGRVRAIYIRDVTSRRRDSEVHRIAQEVSALGVPMILADDTCVAAAHAAGAGLLAPETLEEVRKDSEAHAPRSH